MDKRIDVYLIAGQSNAVGMARLDLLDDQYKREYPHVWLFNGGDGPREEHLRWVPVRPGQGSIAVGIPMFGPELGMASALQRADAPVAFIKYAHGGTAIYRNADLNNKPDNHDNWHGPWDGVAPAADLSQVNEGTSGRLYTECLMTIRAGLAQLREQGYTPVIRGLAWMQGETDGEIQFNNDKHQAAPVYAHNLSALFAAFRWELSDIAGQDLTHMPIVFGEINRFSRCICQAEAIVAAQMAVGREPGNHLVLTEDLPIDPAIDEWHWNGNEEFFLGVRFGETLRAALSDGSPSDIL